MIGLRYMRLLLGIKGEDFVKPINKSASILSKWETRKSKISNKMKTAISNCYGFPIEYLDKELNDEDKHYLETLLSLPSNDKIELEIDRINIKEYRVIKQKMENPYFRNCFELAEKISVHPNRKQMIEFLKMVTVFLERDY